MSTRRPATTFSLQRRIPSRLEEVEALCLEIRALFVSHGLQPVSFAVELVTRECLNNAVLHGNQGRPGRKVSLSLRCGRKWICLRIGDEGPGFDWRKSQPGPPDEASTGGRGFCLLALYGERTRFNESGNQVTLWMRREKKEREK